MSTYEIRSLLGRHIAGELTRYELISTMAQRLQISELDAEELLYWIETNH